MSTFDLISTVRPDGGWYAISGIRGDDHKQFMVETREEVDALVARLVASKRNVFFGVAKFATGDNRKHENVESLKSFWMDIDCWEGKEQINPKTGRPDGYNNQLDGLTALQTFCATIGLPKPTLVSSGRGLHVYWTLAEEVPFAQWTPVAKKLRSLCLQHKFYVDSSVFEASRVLRIPGTFNFKVDPPLPVEVLSVSPPMTFAVFRSIVGTVEDTFLAENKPRRELTALGKAMLNNVESQFAKIMQRGEEGCRQLIACYMERETLSEPRWFDALSIAKFCEDADTAVHKMSEGHPGYSHGAVERKIRTIKGPHSCAEFEAKNAGGCDGCPHKGKITSPIQLGKIIVKSTPEDAEVEVENSAGEVEVVTVPPLPWPFFRSKTGGIYLPPPEDESEEIRVYEHDFYVKKLMFDPVHKYVALCVVHLPQDGIKEFLLPLSEIGDPRSVRKALLSNGITIGGSKAWECMSQFIVASIKEIQTNRRSELMRLQFGWVDDDTKFIVGDREIAADGIYHSPPSQTTSTMQHYFACKGSLDEWKRVFQLYGRPGMELHAFAALTGFGSTLLKFTGQKGAIINLIHSMAGTGKTTVLRMANSVFGDPEGLLGTPEDTKVGRIIKCGILNNLVNTVDELTNISAQDFSNLAYAFSQGKGKDKAKMSSNELRENNTTWRNITLASSNASFAEKLGVLKANPDGELMRLLEFKVDYTDTSIIAVAEGKQLFDHTLNNNYGIAGEVFIQWVICNLREVKETIATVQRKLDKELRLTQRERNYSAVVAANLAGGIIAKHLNLIDWDMSAIYKFIGPKLLEMRGTAIHDRSTTPTEAVADYILRHNNNILIVDSGARANGLMKIPLKEPVGPLLLRYEPDTKRLFMTVKDFKADCVENQVNYKDTIEWLTEAKILVETGVKRLSKGSKLLAPGVYCLVFDCSNADFIDHEALVPPAPQVDAG